MVWLTMVRLAVMINCKIWLVLGVFLFERELGIEKDDAQ